MSEEPIKTLEVKASDEVKSKDMFMQLNQQMQGIGGTLHITKIEDVATIPMLAWQLAQQTGKPVIVVVRATA